MLGYSYILIKDGIRNLLKVHRFVSILWGFLAVGVAIFAFIESDKINENIDHEYEFDLTENERKYWHPVSWEEGKKAMKDWRSNNMLLIACFLLIIGILFIALGGIMFTLDREMQALFVRQQRARLPDIEESEKLVDGFKDIKHVNFDVIDVHASMIAPYIV